MNQLRVMHTSRGRGRAVWLVAAVALASLFVFAPGPAAQGSNRIPWSMTFDTGDLFTGWNGFRNTTGVSILNQGCVAGQCLRSPLIAGTTSDNYGDYYFGDFVGFGGPKVEEIWVRMWSKFESGYSWPSASHKIGILNLTDGVSSTRRFQVIPLVTAQGRYALTLSDIDRWVFSDHNQNVGSPVNVRFGQWDKIKVYVRLNTPNVSNGVIRMWVNDVLKLEYTSVNIRGGTAFGINKFNLSTYATPSSPTNGVQWHDDIILSPTDPDGGTTTPPAPPTNVRIIT
jgi:hypothetical protein